MSHIYYSNRTGKNKNSKGFSLNVLRKMFLRLYESLRSDGYLYENFGGYCVDSGNFSGKISDIELEISQKIKKLNLWPPDKKYNGYTEDDILDIIEFLYQYVSKPSGVYYHGFDSCCMHWENFNKKQGQENFRTKANDLLSSYESPFVLSRQGQILEQPEEGFEKIFNAKVPTSDNNIKSRINSSILKYQRHNSTLDDRKNAVRDLVDILEYLRPQAKRFLATEDEKDLFNLANNFGIRHCNSRQKTNYDTTIWVRWMFYYYLSTIHALIRIIEKEKTNQE